jgi:hypothetical protein
MNYYHLRYNVYEPPGFAVEKEKWITTERPLNVTQARVRLEEDHQNTVSIITWVVIAQDEFDRSDIQQQASL